MNERIQSGTVTIKILMYNFSTDYVDESRGVMLYVNAKLFRLK